MSGSYEVILDKLPECCKLCENKVSYGTWYGCWWRIMIPVKKQTCKRQTIDKKANL